MSTDTPFAPRKLGEVMFVTSVFVHVRPDLDPADIWVQAGDFSSQDRAFQNSIHPFKVKVPEGLRPHNAVVPRDLSNEVDRVLLSVMADCCPIPCSCVILGHQPGKSYLDLDRHLLDGLAKDLQFNLNEVKVYHVESGRVRSGVPFSTYFF